MVWTGAPVPLCNVTSQKTSIIKVNAVETLNLVPGIPLMTTALPKFGSAHIGSEKMSLGCQTVLHITWHTQSSASRQQAN